MAALVTTPFDIVKTLRQIDVAENEIMKSPPTRSQSTKTILNQLLTSKGYRALFTGEFFFSTELVRVPTERVIKVEVYIA